VIVGGHFNNWCQGGAGSGNPVTCVTPIARRHLLATSLTGGVQPWKPNVNSNLGVFALRINVALSTLWAGGDFTVIDGNARNHVAKYSY
jgi:hypothetical protein